MKAAKTENAPARSRWSRRRLFGCGLELLVFVLVCTSLVTLWYGAWYGANRDGDRGHATFRLTAKRVRFWHDQMEQFCSERGRAPTSVGELRDFVRQTCEKNAVSYDDVAHDAWGYELRVTLTRERGYCVLCVESPGPDGEFGPPRGQYTRYLKEYYRDPAGTKR